MSSDSIKGLKKGITESEFKELLDRSVFYDAKQKEKVLSIFTKISHGDGELSNEDWTGFIIESDKNLDGSLSKAEISNSVYKKTSSLYRQCKDAVIDFYNMVKNYIKKSADSNNMNQKGTTEILYSQPNTYRAKGTRGSGTFEGGWIAYDGHEPPSRTFDEWLKNNGYDIDEDVANELFRQAAKRDKKRGQCAAVIADSMSATKVMHPHTLELLEGGHSENNDEEDTSVEELFKSNNLFNEMKSQGSAYKYASELAKNPYFKEIPHNIVATMDLTTLPKGCVIVYDAYYKYSQNAETYDKKFHIHGHIAVTEGNEWDHGDGRYHIADQKQASHIRVFVPVKISNKN